MPRLRLWRAAALSVATVAIAALLPVATAAPANAAVCTFRPHAIHDDHNGGFYGAIFHGDAVCPNAANAPVYRSIRFPEGTFDRNGTMRSTRSWFLCWVHGVPHAGGNDIWYYTQGDVATPGLEFWNAWGWMPARYVFTTNDPGDSRLPQCPPT